MAAVGGIDPRIGGMRHRIVATGLGLLSWLLSLGPPALAQKKVVTRAQSPVRLGPTIGFRLGGLMSMPTGSGLRSLPPGGKVVTFQSRYGFLGGAVFSFRFLPEWAISTEALVSTRGFKRSYTFPLTQREEELQVRQICLDLPVLAHYNYNQFYAELGLVNTIALRSNYKQQVIFPDDKIQTSGTLADARRFGLSAAVGAGVETVEGYFFGARFLYGLSKLGQAPATTAEATMTGQQLTSYSIQLGGGYIFGHQAPATAGPLKHAKKKRRRR